MTGEERPCQDSSCDPGSAPAPEVGDEVEYGPGLHAFVTDIRKGDYYLRSYGRREWPVENPEELTVKRTRAERIAAGDL
ncbi:hypothetical protein [Streptomyces kronopolitis]|uniref:hypothetical protein n=1 Tax=Streptomyces kronopolitis TaxID=1612435 RepID=UPI003675BD33